MRRILVPTDFSEIADNALKYAILLTSAWQSELHLYHIFQFNKFDYVRSAPDDDQPAFRRLERKMNATQSRFTEEVKDLGLTMRTTVEECDSYSLFTERIRQYKFDMVVMGSKGASGIKKVVYGSFAANAIEWSGIPVWIVPPNTSFAPLKHIVFAVDDQPATPSLWSLLQVLADRDQAKVSIIRIRDQTMVPQTLDDVVGLSGIDWNYLEIPLERNINQTISDYVSEHNVDLLCMIRRTKDFVSSIFKKSITRNQALTNYTPLLIIPEVYKMRKTQRKLP